MTLCVVPEGLAAASAAVEALTASAGLMAVADGGSGVAIHRGRVQLCRRRACDSSGPRCPRVGPLRCRGGRVAHHSYAAGVLGPRRRI